jgi:two-component system, OmpR family, sensor histidine kinase BaeS
MRSLNWKLGGALLLMVMVSIGLMAYLTNLSTVRELRHYVSNVNTVYVQRIEHNLALFYVKEQSWAGIQSALEASLKSADDRLIVVNNIGVVVGDSAGDWVGKDIAEYGLGDGTPILVLGKKVGEFYVDGMVANGHSGRIMGQLGQRISTVLTIAEQDFLKRVHASLLLAGLLAAGLAVLLGLIITRQITRPVHALMTGARRIAGGQLNYRVEVNTNDEIGALASSFNDMASSLSKNEESRRRLLADIAHELRTPLTVIEGTVEGILDGVFEPDAERLNLIKGETTLLTRLINDLRDISLAESGQLKLELAPADIIKLVSRKLSQVEPLAREKEVQLDLQAAHDIPELRVDLLRMEQVIANLVTNAIRHTSSGGKVTVSLDKIAGSIRSGLEKPQVIISIADNGEGIEAEHLSKIFDRFYRVDSARARGKGETGLGLAIVKQMVEAHGGKVWVESEKGKGSTFYVALPVQADASLLPEGVL